MKFEQAEEKFQPVTITLESKEEAMVLTAALSHAGGNEAGDVLFRLYRSLLDVVPDWEAAYRSRPTDTGIVVEKY